MINTFENKKLYLTKQFAGVKSAYAMERYSQIGGQLHLMFL